MLNPSEDDFSFLFKVHYFFSFVSFYLDRVNYLLLPCLFYFLCPWNDLFPDESG